MHYYAKYKKYKNRLKRERELVLGARHLQGGDETALKKTLDLDDVLNRLKEATKPDQYFGSSRARTMRLIWSEHRGRFVSDLEKAILAARVLGVDRKGKLYKHALSTAQKWSEYHKTYGWCSLQSYGHDPRSGGLMLRNSRKQIGRAHV